jgi:hypothetical protein
MKILVGIVLLVVGTCAAADDAPAPRTGRDLKAWAEGVERFHNPQDFADAGKLHGYVLGIADALSERKLLCFDARANSEQLVAVTLQYLKARAERVNAPAYQVVADALQSKYACKS